MIEKSCSRRGLLRSLAGGSLLLPGIVAGLLADDEKNRASDPLAPKPPHHAPKAKRMILLYSSGGVSHMDTFDHKPKLLAADGKTLAVGGGLSRDKKPILRPLWDFRPGGKCGTMVSDLFPNVRECMDDIALIRSMKSDDNEHYQATLAIHTGSFFFSRPSMGSWISYGMGTLNRSLPSFVVIAPHLPYAGSQVYASDFLPAYHQGTRVTPGADPIPNLARRTKVEGLQEMELGLAAAFDGRHLKENDSDGALAARIRSFETAYAMQREAPDVLDLSKESDETLKMYGLKRGKTEGYAWQCLVARRLAEAGVRFIELIDTGSSNNWDQHDNMPQHANLARAIDRPIAALLQDLKRRGMLDETLVVWTTEFGRTPGVDGPKGRGHHGACFSSWMAGGGVRGGVVHGSTDEIGAVVAEGQVHVHDFHATILHLLGIDHTKLTYRHAGRDFRLTDVHGNVVTQILA